MSEAQPYVAAWLAREPGMELAQVFVPAPRRERFAAWGALLHQLDEAAFEVSDANVSRTKLAWWGEELAAMAAGQSRHPLARALALHESVRAVPAPDWHALANAAILARGSDNAPADIDALLAQGAPYARVTARIEQSIFADEARDGREAAGALAVHHALRRLEHSLGRDATQFPWPLNLRARHQAAPGQFAQWRDEAAARAVVSDLASALAANVASVRRATAFRRAQAALDARRLQHLAAGGEKPLRATGPRTLWALWRAARCGA